MTKMGQKEQYISSNWCTQDTRMVYKTPTLVQMGLVQQCMQVICTNWFSVTRYISYQLQLVD